MSHLSDLFFSKINNSQTNFTDVCGRYAPSPTGPLHFGNLRTALIAWLQARLANGRFILRIEDIDLPRTRPGSAEEIVHDLKWLGLDWDEGPDVSGQHAPYTQSERFELYQTAIEYLIKQNKLFTCTCSRKDITQAASAPHEPNRRLIYPGTCRPAESSIISTSSKQQTSLRFICPEKHIEFNDVILGKKNYTLHQEVGDFVIKRADGLYSYHLAVVLDDALMGVSDIVRGSDLIDSTAQQILLYQAFGFPIPKHWHIPLVMDETTGKRLAKRDGALSISHYREQGIDAPTLIGMLAASLNLVEKDSRLSARELLSELTIEQLTSHLKQHTS